MKWDVIEIIGMDDLYYLEDVILEVEELFVECYGSKKSYFLVNGISGGSLVVIMVMLKYGEKVLVLRDVYKLILYGIELVGGELIFLILVINKEVGVVSGVIIEFFEEILYNYLDVKLCIFIYLSYYGMIFNLYKCI